MAKKKQNNDEAKRADKEKLDACLEKLKDKDKLSEEELDQLSNEIMEIINNNKLSKLVYYLAYVFRFIAGAVILYAIAICTMGFFIYSIAIENKYFTFAIVGIVVGILMLYRAIFNNYIALRVDHPFITYGICVLILSLIGVLINNYFYKFFNNDFFWLLYIPLVMTANGIIYIRNLKRKMGL